MLSSLVVAVVLAVAYLAYDVALSRGVALPGGDLRTLAVAVYVLLVLVIGSVVTYLVVPQPTGSGTVARRSAGARRSGSSRRCPIAYLVMVVAVQIVRPAAGLTARTTWDVRPTHGGWTSSVQSPRYRSSLSSR